MNVNKETITKLLRSAPSLAIIVAVIMPFTLGFILSEAFISPTTAKNVEDVITSWNLIADKQEEFVTAFNMWAEGSWNASGEVILRKLLVEEELLLNNFSINVATGLQGEMRISGLEWAKQISLAVQNQKDAINASGTAFSMYLANANRAWDLANDAMQKIDTAYLPMLLVASVIGYALIIGVGLWIRRDKGKLGLYLLLVGLLLFATNAIFLSSGAGLLLPIIIACVGAYYLWKNKESSLKELPKKSSRITSFSQMGNEIFLEIRKQGWFRTIELKKEEGIRIGESFIIIVKFLKDGVPVEPSEKKITIEMPDGSIEDQTSRFSKIRLKIGVYRKKSTGTKPMGPRLLNVSATIDGSNVSFCEEYNVVKKSETACIICIIIIATVTTLSSNATRRATTGGGPASLPELIGGIVGAASMLYILYLIFSWITEPKVKKKPPSKGHWIGSPRIK